MESPAPVAGADLRSPWEEGPHGVLDIGDAGHRFAHLSISDRGGHGLGHGLGCAMASNSAGAAGDASLFQHTPCGSDVSPMGHDPVPEAAPRFPPPRRLYAQSSMVARLAEDKNFVDPKDVPKLLPQQLLDSKSLDLAGILDSMEENDELPPDFAPPPQTPPVADPVVPRPPSRGDPSPPGLPRAPRPDGSVRDMRPGMIGTRSAPSYRKLPPQYVDHAAHNRSSSEPVYGEALAAVPVLALVPASRLPAVSAAFPPLGAQLWADCQKRAGEGRKRKGARAKPGRKDSASGSSPAEWEGGRGRATHTPETPGSSVGEGSRGGSRGSRRKGAKKSGQGKQGEAAMMSATAAAAPVARMPSRKAGGSVAGAKVPIGAAGSKLKTRKSVSKGEVKRLVRYQVWVGRPIRTPWYREKPRGMRKDGGEDSESEEEGSVEDSEFAAGSPCTPQTPTPKGCPKPPIRPRIITQRVSSTGSSSAGTGTPVAAAAAAASPSSPDIKGTGFFCPRSQAAGRK